uniref:Transmembrane protein n=1 Tax=Cannabis sativa TaxID=3483 RepID=A0A803QTG5_CANSA
MPIQVPSSSTTGVVRGSIFSDHGHQSRSKLRFRYMDIWVCIFVINLSFLLIDIWIFILGKKILLL